MTGGTQPSRWSWSWALVLITSITGLGCYGEDSASLSSAPSPTTPLPSARAAGPDLALTAVPVAGDPSILGTVGAFVDLDSRVIVFGDKGVIALAGGVPATTAPNPPGPGGAASSVTWTGAARVASPDRTGTWGVGLSSNGKLFRLRDVGRLDDVTARFGIAPNEPISQLLPIDEKRLAIALERELVIVDIERGGTTRFDSGPLRALSASASGRVAGLDGDNVTTIDTVAGKVSRRTVAKARATQFDAAGRLLVLTEHSLLRETPSSSFETILTRDDVALEAIHASGPRVWFVAGTELWALESDVIRRAAGVTIAPTPQPKLTTSPGGDVWLHTTSLSRYRVQVSPQESAWISSIQPIFQRVCSSCHTPGGTARVDLSSYSSWVTHRTQIEDRVFTNGSMPPPPSSLTADERAAVSLWLKGPF